MKSCIATYISIPAATGEKISEMLNKDIPKKDISVPNTFERETITIRTTDLNFSWEEKETKRIKPSMNLCAMIGTRANKNFSDVKRKPPRKNPSKK